MVSYSDGSEVLKSFVFDVKEINDAPTLLSDQLVTVDEDSQLTYRIQVADEEDSSENLQINIPNGGYVLNENSDLAESSLANASDLNLYVENGKLFIGQPIEEQVREDLGFSGSLIVHQSGQITKIGDAETNLYIGFDPTADNPTTPETFLWVVGRGYDATLDNFDDITGFVGNIVGRPNGGGAVIGTDPNEDLFASIKILYDAGKLQILEEKHLWQLQTYAPSWDPTSIIEAVNKNEYETYQGYLAT